MDYTTVPRSLIYRDRRSMEEFGAYQEESITRPLAEAMLRMDFIQHSDSENRALWCMNTAYYICTMILLEIDPRWRLSKYKSIAIPKWNFRSEEFQILTLSLAGLLLSRLEEPLHLLSMKGQTRNHFISLMLDEGKFNYIFKELYERVEADRYIKRTIPNSAFAPRKIDKECIHDVMSDSAFNWVHFTNFMEERSIRDIVKAFGNTEDEKHNVLDMLRQASHGFYTAGYNDRPEQVDSLLDDIGQEIHLHYNPEDAVVDEDGEQEQYLELKPLKEARIDMLKGENAKLREEIEQLKEYIKNAITIDVDNEVVDLGEFGSIVDNTSKTHNDAINKVERNESADSLQENENDEIHRQKLADAQKTIEEQAQTIYEQQAELERLSTLNEVLTKQNARYDEENPEMNIDEGTALSIKENIIFFSSIMDCNLSKEDISQTNFARLISKITRWPKESIRPQIVDINTERVNNAKNHTAFSDGVHQAAVNVCALIENAMTGLKKNPLPYSCKQAVENICRIYKSPGRKIEPHEIAEAKKNLKKI